MWICGETRMEEKTREERQVPEPETERPEEQEEEEQEEEEEGTAGFLRTTGLRALEEAVAQTPPDAAAVRRAAQAFAAQPLLLDARLPALVAALAAPRPVRPAALAALCELAAVRGAPALARCLPHTAATHLAPVLAAARAAYADATDAVEEEWDWRARYVAVLWLATLVLEPFPLAVLETAAFPAPAQAAAAAAARTAAHADLAAAGAGTVFAQLAADAADAGTGAGSALLLAATAVALRALQDRSSRGAAAGACLLARLATRADAPPALLAAAVCACTTGAPAALAEREPYAAAALLALLAALLRAADATVDPAVAHHAHRVVAIATDSTKSAQHDGQEQEQEQQLLLGCRSGVMASALGARLRCKVLQRAVLAVLAGGARAGIAAREVQADVERGLGALLAGVAAADTAARWAAAKGVARIAARLPAPAAREVVARVVALLAPLAPATTWHGACLALAACARHHLLDNLLIRGTEGKQNSQQEATGATTANTLADTTLGTNGTTTATTTASETAMTDLGEKLGQGLAAALVFDEPRGSSSVGANVRDAGALACWALARAVRPRALAPLLAPLLPALLAAALYDRETHCRRAAAAALQEVAGRQGAALAHGAALAACVAYDTVACRRRAFLAVAPRAAALAPPGCRAALAAHVARAPLAHWDRAVRALAAPALAALVAHDAPAQHALLRRLAAHDARAPDPARRHGALLAAACILEDCSADAQAAGHEPVVPPDVAETLVDTVPHLEQQRLFRGRGTDCLREAVCRFIAAVAHARLPMKRPPAAATSAAQGAPSTAATTATTPLAAAYARARAGAMAAAAAQRPRVAVYQGVVDDCLVCPYDAVQAAAAAATGALWRTYYVSRADAHVLAAPRPVARALARYCAALADAHANPAARRGNALALGSLPAAVFLHLYQQQQQPQQQGADNSSGTTAAATTEPTLHDVLGALDAAARCAPGARPEERDAETRRNAVRAAAALVATVARVAAADGATDSDDGVATTLVRTVLAPWARALLCAAAEDHAGDARGDVGAWVRAEALAGLRTLAAHGVLSSASDTSDATATALAAAVCSQLGARLVPLRAAAAATLRALAPCLPRATRAVVAATAAPPPDADTDADALALCDALLADTDTDVGDEAAVRAAVVRGLVAAAGSVPPDAAAAAVLARHRAAVLPGLCAAVRACATAAPVRRHLAPALLTVLAHTFAAATEEDDDDAALAQDTLAWVRSAPLWRSADYALIDGTLAVLGALAHRTTASTAAARVLLAAVRVRHPFPVVRARAAAALGLAPPAPAADRADDPAVCAQVCAALGVAAEQLPPIDIPAAAVAAAPSSAWL